MVVCLGMIGVARCDLAGGRDVCVVRSDVIRMRACVHQLSVLGTTGVLHQYEVAQRERLPGEADRCDQGRGVVWETRHGGVR